MGTLSGIFSKILRYLFPRKCTILAGYTPVELRKIFANILSVVWPHFLFGGGFVAPNFQSLVQFDVKLDLHRRIYLCM